MDSYSVFGGLQGRPPLQLVLVCASYEGRSRALFNDTAPRATGRSDGRDREVWMGCRASLTAAVLNVRRMGMRRGRAPQIAIPPSRPATPRTLTRRFAFSALSPLCLFAFSFHLT